MKTQAIVPLSQTNPDPFIAQIPGSKSFTNRALIIAAQRQGTTVIENALHADDTDGLARCLGLFGGLETEKTATGYRVTRTAARLTAPTQALHIGAAGTPARLLLSFAAAADGDTIITGNQRLCERPMDHLLQSFDTIGVRYECLGTKGCLPVKVYGSQVTTRQWPINSQVSSQFVSSLLLFAAQQPSPDPVTVTVTDHLVSRPYVEMTVQSMQNCGIEVEVTGPKSWTVTPGQANSETIVVETDASGMSYFLAAAAITQTQIIIPSIGRHSIQGDVGFVQVLGDMGCTVALQENTIELTGAPLRGIAVDMETMPDVVLTLAAVAAHATGTTQVMNIANLRVKECDRISAAITELRRLGVAGEEGEDWLAVHSQGGSTDPNIPKTQNILPASIHTYDDHRVAMAFALMGLLHEGLVIEDPDCVAKSFPSFWQEFDRFCAHHQGS
jgi:3-phosphoshikimate 1-carboxyvinyltransferase